MNVPQPAQGYPSDARSSRPQARQVMASCSWSSAIRYSGGNIVALDLVDQRGARYPELDGGPGSVSGVMFQGTLDVLALEIFQAEGSVPPIADSGSGPELSRQVLHTDGGLAPAENQRPLQDVPHLANVSGPGITEQPLEHLTGERRWPV